MKFNMSLLFLCLMVCLGVPTYAQVEKAPTTTSFCYVKEGKVFQTICDYTPCNCEGKHEIFNIPTTDKNLKKLSRLGSYPQFGTLKYLKDKYAVFEYLKKVHKEGKNGNATELDRLWTAMGYSGFNDPDFTVEDMNPVLYDFGIKGMLGDGAHKYVYSQILGNENDRLLGYKITPKNSCGVTIMETCGNAFFAGCENASNCVEKECSYDAAKLGGAAKYAYYTEAKEQQKTCYVGTYSNVSCTDKHPIYNLPIGTTPKYLARLGSYPQFGTLKYLNSTQEVYDYLKGVYKANKSGNAAELDRLWIAMGYSGFNDPDYTVSDVQEVLYQNGLVGNIGDGAHRYVYSEIHGGADGMLKGYKMTPKNGCGITIMETCGNAFFAGIEYVSSAEVPCDCAK
jgi:hypothetical protein